MDDDAKKIRSSLMALSLYLILYWLADGDIGAGGEVKIWTISFGEPVWVKVAGLLIFFYLLWRYHINGKLAYDEFIAGIYLNLAASSEYIDYVVECESFCRSLPEEALKKIKADRRVWPHFQFEKNVGYSGAVFMPPLPGGYVYPDIIYTSARGASALSWVAKIRRIKKGNMGAGEIRVHDFTNEERRALRRFIAQAFKESLQSSNDFYQIIVPYIMAAFAVFSLLANASIVLALTLLAILVLCATVILGRAIRG